jgi:hypothetical protein
MRSRTGCFAGCVVVLALVLLYPLVLLAQILVPLALGLFFPWEPPIAEDAPEGAVLTRYGSLSTTMIRACPAMSILLKTQDPRVCSPSLCWLFSFA